MKRCLLSATCERPEPSRGGLGNALITIGFIAVAAIAGCLLVQSQKKIEHTAEQYNAWLAETNTALARMPGGAQAAFTGDKPGRVVTIRVAGALPGNNELDAQQGAASAASLGLSVANSYMRRFEGDLSVEVTVEQQLAGGGMWMETFHDIVLRSEWEKQQRSN
jgi:hypothetical protein